MTAPWIVAIGASAGGLEALTRVLGALNKGFPAPIVVVLHLSPGTPSILAKILSRSTGFAAIEATDGQPLVPGRACIAPPDHHLLVHDGVVRLAYGPRENHNRPAVDPLFRSAARVYGARAVGVVLSGALDDGTAGLLAIKRAGGVAVVQSPGDAVVSGMPASAIANVPVDHVVPASEIGAVLAEVVERPAGPRPRASTREVVTNNEDKIAELDAGAARETQEDWAPSPFVCPDCGGTLFEVRDTDLMRFRCRVGHAYSQESLFAAEEERLEEALWIALRRFDEHANISRRAAAQARQRKLGHVAERYELAARDDEVRAEQLRRVLTSKSSSPSEARVADGDGDGAAET